MRVVTDWKSCWRWLSVHFIVAGAALQGAFMAFPAALQQYVPDWVMHAVAIALLAAAFLGRLVDQKKDS